LQIARSNSEVQTANTPAASNLAKQRRGRGGTLADMVSLLLEMVQNWVVPLEKTFLTGGLRVNVLTAFLLALTVLCLPLRRGVYA